MTPALPNSRRIAAMGAAAMGAGAVLLLTACGTATSAGAASVPVTAISTAPATTTAATASGSAATGETVPADDPAAVAAQEYLQLRAAGDPAAWDALSATSQAAWPDRAAHDAVVAETAPQFAALLAVNPTLTPFRTAGGDITVLTAHGVVDPNGSPRVVARAVVVDSDNAVMQGPEEAEPAFTWVNPTLEGAGTLGYAEFDATAPLTVQLGAGAGVSTVNVDGQNVDLPATAPSQDADGGTTTTVPLPELAPAEHVVTVVFGYPGEITQARTVLVNTDVP